MFIVMVLLFLLFEIQDYQKNTPLHFKTKNGKEKRKINEFMYNWINSGSKVAIFSNDMSWANKNEIVDLLIKKASKSELEIYLPNNIELTNKLSAHGAKIYTYGDFNYIPKTRFTIINQGRDDAQVAIGRNEKDGIFVIKKFSIGNHPAFSIADDLINILKILNERIINEDNAKTI